MKLLAFVMNLGIYLVILTTIGQIRVRGENLESRYHRMVTSEKFQKTYWAIMKPATWTLNHIGTFIKTEEQPQVR